MSVCLRWKTSLWPWTLTPWPWKLNQFVTRLWKYLCKFRLDKLFSMYSDDTVSTCNLRSVVSDIFLDDIYVHVHVHVHYVHIVKLIYFIFFSLVLLPMWWNKDKYPFSSSWTIDLIRFPWPSPADHDLDLDLWPSDLDNVTSVMCT